MEDKSLIKLMDEYLINVPRIQRDYAQGREGEHPGIVRKKLLNDIYNAVNSNTSLDLSFVYGRASEVENGNKIFFPADGQQRLTTLFLIHIVAFYDDASKDGLLERFTYDARPTTRDFLKKLTEKRYEVFDELKKMNDFEEQNNDEDKTTPKKLIRDASWYYDSWNYDPSVKSALTVLNDIWELWKDPVKRNTLKTRLEDEKNPPVFIHFLPLEELGREDDLYIKLNARGLPLTAFENFKSAFLDRTEKCVNQLYNETSANFDGKWSNFIWDTVKTGYDRAYISFFEIVFQNCEILKTEANKELSKEWHYDLDYSLIPSDVIEAVRNTLNYLSENAGTDEVKIVKRIISTEKKTYPDRVMLHCIYKYLSDENNCKSVNKHALEEWIRIFRNLIQNTTIDNAESYKHAIDGINSVFPQKNSLLDDLANSKVSINGFNSEQFAEECQKARIMKMDGTKYQNIISAEEKLKYFSGQIRCAIKISDYEVKRDDSLFNDCIDKLDLLFDETKPYYGVTLRRALLSFGDYRHDVGKTGIKTFCVDDPNEGTSTPSLKRLFSECGDQVQKLINALTVPAPNTPDRENQLNDQILNIIKANNSSIQQKDWRYCMISYPDLFDCMGAGHLRVASDSDEIILVGQKHLNSNNTSVYLKALAKDYGSKASVEDCSTQKGQNKWYRYLKIKGKFISFSNQKYKIYDVLGASPIWESSGKRPDIITEVEDYLANV